MDSDNSSTKIEKLNNSNYHFWKIRIQHILTLKDLDQFLDEDPPTTPDFTSDDNLPHRTSRPTTSLLG